MMKSVAIKSPKGPTLPAIYPRCMSLSGKTLTSGIQSASCLEESTTVLTRAYDLTRFAASIPMAGTGLQPSPKIVYSLNKMHLLNLKRYAIDNSVGLLIDHPPLLHQQVNSANCLRPALLLCKICADKDAMHSSAFH